MFMFEKYNLHELFENDFFFYGMVFFALVIILINLSHLFGQFLFCLCDYYERKKIRKQFLKICEDGYYHIEENVIDGSIHYFICDKENCIQYILSVEDNARTICAALNDDLAGRKFNVNVCKGGFNIYKYLKSHKDGQEVKKW